MNFIAVLAALGLEQWRAFRWRAGLERGFIAYAHWLEEKLDGGTTRQGVVAVIDGKVSKAGGKRFAARTGGVARRRFG